MTRPVAFVTGASRGIGRASAIALSGAGFDVAVAARTMKDGSARLSDDDQTVVPGGLDTTVEAIEAAGGAGFAVRLDLLDRRSVDAACAAVLDRFGGVDVLVNNAIYQGPASMSEFLDLDEVELERQFEGNVFAQLAITRQLLPPMIQRGGGTIINMISATAHLTPPGRIGSGGWGMSYAMSKAAFERVAPLLTVEHGDDNIVCFSVDPDYVVTERAQVANRDRGFDHRANTPEVIGRAVAWLATDADVRARSGEVIFAAREARKNNLV